MTVLATRKLSAFLADDEGATAIEYGLIAALTSIILIIGVTALNAKMVTLYDTIGNALGGALP